jgi:hemoglobin
MSANPTNPLTPYQLIGEAAGIARLVERFYLIMDTDPNARAVRAVHGPSLQEAAEKLQDFLSGWLGGPPLFMLKHGHPRMRMRHMNFAIGAKEREEWLYCMRQAMADCSLPPQLVQGLETGFRELALKIQNRD